jgi:hypothetical protein
MIIGLLQPTEGQLSVLGETSHAPMAARLARVGYVAQDHPLYRDFSIADTFIPWLAIRLVVEFLLRPHFEAPLTFRQVCPQNGGCFGGIGRGALPPVTGHIGDWVLGFGGGLPANQPAIPTCTSRPTGSGPSSSSRPAYSCCSRRPRSAPRSGCCTAAPPDRPISRTAPVNSARRVTAVIGGRSQLIAQNQISNTLPHGFI